MITRLGNKRKIARRVVQAFPPQIDHYYEPFLGGAGMAETVCRSYTLKSAHYNDLDKDLFAFWCEFKRDSEALFEELLYLPQNESGLRQMLDNRAAFNPTMQAALYFAQETWLNEGLYCRNLPLQKNFVDLGKSLFPFSSSLHNLDFEPFLREIVPPNVSLFPLDKHFVYVDSPYLWTMERYGTPKWGLESSTRLLDTLAALNVDFVMSEFDTPAVGNLARERGFAVRKLLDRYVGNSQKTEILITNTARK